MSPTFWHAVGEVANATIAAAYLLIAHRILVPLWRTGQLRSNQLGTATGMIFFSCAGGHALHAIAYVTDEHATMPWWQASWDVFTAGIGIWYWTLRRSFGRLLARPLLFDDLKERQRRALEINDDVVQSLVVATYALDLGQPDRARAAVSQALASSRSIMTDLLGQKDSPMRLGPGDLVRERAAGTVSPQAPASPPRAAPPATRE